MSSSVTVGGFEVTSSTESAQEMVENLTPAKEPDKTPRAKMDRGKPVEPEAAPATEAARELGKRGGEASAKAREERAKEAEKAPPAEAKPVEEKPEQKAEETEKGENPRHSARARVEQATRQLAEERRANRELMERLNRLEQAVKPPEQRESAPKAPDGRPNLDDFGTYEEYVEALTDWKTDRKLEEREQKAARERQHREAIETFSKRAVTFHERLDKAAGGEKAKLEEVLPILGGLKTRDMLEPGEQVTASVDLADEIVDSERPLEILQFLQSHPDVYEGLLASRDTYELKRAFGRVYGRMEAMLERDAVPASERRPSSAPAPMRPVAPSVQPGEVDFSADMPFDKFAALKGLRRR